MSDRLYLHSAKDHEGRIRVYDQHGRELSGIRSVEARSAINEVNGINLEVIEMHEGGEVLK